MDSLLIVILSAFCLQTGFAQDSVEYQVIPLTFFNNSGMLNAMTSSQAFVNFHFGKKRPCVKSNIGSVAGDSKLKYLGSENLCDVERSSLQASMLDHAGCEPYDSLISLPNPRPDVVMYPSCVRIKQCGGCCGHPALMCKPTKTKDRLIQVVKYIYDGSSMSPEEKLDYVTVEEHEECDCQCKVQPSECNPTLQSYDHSECRCVCKNNHLSTSCPFNKKWNQDTCACQCSRVTNCGAGHTFNLNSCNCEEDASRNGGLLTRPAMTTTPKEVVTSNPCAHLRCPRRYKPLLQAGGRCSCIFDRTSV